jgi:hypothetical protein
MIERDTARSLAQKAVPDGRVIDPERFTETRAGWYFPYSPTDLIGSNGVIVHKTTGRALVLGSAFSVERDMRAFDDGFQFKLYDLVVLEIDLRLGKLPVVFPEIHLYFRIEALQAARDRSYFRFEALECRRPT